MCGFQSLVPAFPLHSVPPSRRFLSRSSEIGAGRVSSLLCLACFTGYIQHCRAYLDVSLLCLFASLVAALHQQHNPRNSRMWSVHGAHCLTSAFAFHALLIRRICSVQCGAHRSWSLHPGPLPCLLHAFALAVPPFCFRWPASHGSLHVCFFRRS